MPDDEILGGLPEVLEPPVSVPEGPVPVPDAPIPVPLPPGEPPLPVPEGPGPVPGFSPPQIPPTGSAAEPIQMFHRDIWEQTGPGRLRKFLRRETLRLAMTEQEKTELLAKGAEEAGGSLSKSADLLTSSKWLKFDILDSTGKAMRQRVWCETKDLVSTPGDWVQQGEYFVRMAETGVPVLDGLGEPIIASAAGALMDVMPAEEAVSVVGDAVSAGGEMLLDGASTFFSMFFPEGGQPSQPMFSYNSRSGEVQIDKAGDSFTQDGPISDDGAPKEAPAEVDLQDTETDTKHDSGNDSKELEDNENGSETNTTPNTALNIAEAVETPKATSNPDATFHNDNMEGWEDDVKTAPNAVDEGFPKEEPVEDDLQDFQTDSEHDPANPLKEPEGIENEFEITADPNKASNTGEAAGTPKPTRSPEPIRHNGELQTWEDDVETDVNDVALTTSLVPTAIQGTTAAMEPLAQALSQVYTQPKDADVDIPWEFPAPTRAAHAKQTRSTAFRYPYPDGYSRRTPTKYIATTTSTLTSVRTIKPTTLITITKTMQVGR